MVTVVSVAILLPGAFSGDYKAVILSFTVLLFSRLVDSTGGIADWIGLSSILHALECVIDIGALGLCFYYLAALMGDSVDTSSGSNIPLSGNGESCLYTVIFASAFYIATDIFFCARRFVRNMMTKRCVMKLVTAEP